MLFKETASSYPAADTFSVARFFNTMTDITVATVMQSINSRTAISVLLCFIELVCRFVIVIVNFACNSYRNASAISQIAAGIVAVTALYRAAAI